MKSIFICIFLLCPVVFISAQQEEIKMMSYNIRLDVASDGENQWGLRKDKVAALINYYEPDFAGLQEVLRHQLAYLRDSLIGYAYIGAGRDDGKERGEYSCIFYNKNKYDLLQQSTFWLSPTPDTPIKGWDAAIIRVCTYGLFRNKKTKQNIWVFNTHFDHIGKTARLESAKLIVETIKEMNTENYPVLVSGDFNSRPDEPPAQHMIKYLKDTYTEAGQTYGGDATWNAFQFHEKPDGRIDYVFVSDNKKVKVQKFAIITDSYDMKYPSDHFPVMATIKIDK